MNQYNLCADPVFVVGAHRSGSTLLHLMLNHHPEISAPGEFDFLTEIMADRRERPSAAEYLESLLLHRQFLKLDFECGHSDTYESLVRSFVAQLFNRYPAKVFVLVVHSGFHELVKIWPNAKFVHIVRDPRDVAASAVKLGWAGNVYTGVKRWVRAETEWRELMQSVPETNRFQVRFESLITNLTSTLSTLCEFLRVPYSDQMLTYPRDTSYSSPDPTLINQWKTKLTPTDIGIIEGNLGDSLRFAGYEASGHQKIVPNAWMMLCLLMQDRIIRFRGRLRRFGALNTLGVTFARRFRLKGIEKHYKMRINEISMRDVK